MKNIQLSWVLVVILSLVVAIFAYKFTAGAVAPSDEGRLAVLISKDERNALLLEMRTWLESAQGVLAAANKGDMTKVATIARVSGMAAEEETPGSLFAKIPIAMKTLGFATRVRFDDMAKMAEEGKSSQEISTYLADTMNNCIACHAMYTFVDEATVK